jgi:hypothetical protein
MRRDQTPGPGASGARACRGHQTAHARQPRQAPGWEEPSCGRRRSSSAGPHGSRVEGRHAGSAALLAHVDHGAASSPASARSSATLCGCTSPPHGSVELGQLTIRAFALEAVVLDHRAVLLLDIALVVLIGDMAAGEREPFRGTETHQLVVDGDRAKQQANGVLALARSSSTSSSRSLATLAMPGVSIRRCDLDQQFAFRAEAHR